MVRGACGTYEGSRTKDHVTCCVPLYHYSSNSMNSKKIKSRVFRRDWWDRWDSLLTISYIRVFRVCRRNTSVHAKSRSCDRVLVKVSDL